MTDREFKRLNRSRLTEIMADAHAEATAIIVDANNGRETVILP